MTYTPCTMTYFQDRTKHYTLFFSYKNMLSRSEPWEEIEIATNRITTMFLYFGKSEPQCSYKHGSHKKKRVYVNSCLNFPMYMSSLSRVVVLLDVDVFVVATLLPNVHQELSVDN